MIASIGILPFLFCGMVLFVGFLECRLILMLMVGTLRRQPGPKKAFFSKPAIAIHCVAFIGGLCIAYGYFTEPYWIEVNTVKVSTNKMDNVSLRVVQISDLHCDLKPRNEVRMVELINAMEPDVIVFTGDALNHPKALDYFKATLSKLKAKIAKVAIQGNIDLWHSSELDMFDGTGFQELAADRLLLEKDGKVFTISGVNFGRFGEYKQVLKDNLADQFNIFLFHTPDLIEDLGGLNVDLYLAGHTHGGQVALPFYGAMITFSKFGKKYEVGKYEFADTILYVNRGLGMEGGRAPRVRFLARPEITVFDIGKP